MSCVAMSNMSCKRAVCCARAMQPYLVQGKVWPALLLAALPFTALPLAALPCPVPL